MLHSHPTVLCTLFTKPLSFPRCMHTPYPVPQYVTVSVLSFVLGQPECRTPPGDRPSRAPRRPPPPRCISAYCVASESRPPPNLLVLCIPPPHLPFLCVMHITLWPGGHFLLRHAYTLHFQLRISLSVYLKIHSTLYQLELFSFTICAYCWSLSITFSIYPGYIYVTSTFKF
jgi:hypothetical protein